MAFEIETKLKVDLFDEIESRLRELGANFVDEKMQTDYYLDKDDRALTKSDSCLRLRVVRIDDDIFADITYKGAKQKSDVKKRQEIVLEVSDAETALAIFAAIGYEKQLVIEKKRRCYDFAGCEVLLDELALLGNFVEIEGPDEKMIASVQCQLDLSGLKHIEQSYAELMESKLAELGITQKEIHLETEGND